MNEGPEPRPTGPDGIGGWLLLPIIGLFLRPFAAAGLIYLTILPFFTDGLWDSFTVAGGENYHHLAGSLIIYQIVLRVALALSAIILLVLAFRKHPLFPTGMVIYYLGALFFILVSHFLTLQIPAMVELNGKGLSVEIIRQSLTTLVGVPYFLLSRRVKNTFRS